MRGLLSYKLAIKFFRAVIINAPISSAINFDGELRTEITLSRVIHLSHLVSTTYRIHPIYPVPVPVPGPAPATVLLY